MEAFDRNNSSIPWQCREPYAKTYSPVIISVALTGTVPSKQKYPQLPITPQEIADQALACGEAGAAVIHLHMRDSLGRPSQDPERFYEAITLIRRSMPELVICATTTSRGGESLSSRTSVLSLPKEALPDTVSWTLGSYNVPGGINTNPETEIVAIAESARDRGVALEAEIFDASMIQTFYRLRETHDFGNISLFNVLLGVQGAAPANVFSLVDCVQRLPVTAEWGVAGIGRFQKPMIVAALVMGGNVRVGMEDDPRGEWEGWSNTDAVLRAVALANSLDRPIASPLDARKKMGLAS